MFVGGPAHGVVITYSPAEVVELWGARYRFDGCAMRYLYVNT